ncbi:lanthionine synthetase C family protein [Streptomyces albireticuli]|uniref:lanthionine synthetase C family protein n=1 Tax=Streptomyces albireticuli TaxID=1940 RepID=UPI0036AFCCCD
MTDRPWTTALPPGVAASVLGLVTTMAGPPRAVPTRVRHDLADGGPGLALAYAQLDRCAPDPGPRAMASGYLAATVEGAESAGTPPGLFGGLAGPAFAAWSLSCDTASLTALDERVRAEVPVRARALARAHGVATRAFDVISGLTGTGAYLLCRAAEDPASEDALRTVLTSLVALCGERAGLPHWHTPVEAIRDAGRRAECPYGALNCGMAHGIAGTVALLALALRSGITVPGHREALVRAAAWLGARSSEDEWGPDWPAVVPLPGPSSAAPPARPMAGRGSWCYGAPGIARALWLAGDALGDDRQRALAVRALKAAHRRPPARRRAGTAPGLCHGMAGLLQITLRFAHDTGDADFSAAAVELTRRLLTWCEKDRAFAEEGPGFLDGAAGVVLALLAAATDAAPAWDRALLLS